MEGGRERGREGGREGWRAYLHCCICCIEPAEELLVSEHHVGLE
jgi:hypothetical protein